jgi:UDP-N-acetylmuramyl tripeptide synthase
MPKQLLIILGKAIQQTARLRGGGSALPGLIIERLDPNFLNRILSDLPYGVAIISGTNGKTTTTKMTVELLESQGLKVFTNKTGSNFTRGVAAALLSEIDLKGKLDADIAVLELDEAHAVHFVNKIIKFIISLITKFHMATISIYCLIIINGKTGLFCSSISRVDIAIRLIGAIINPFVAIYLTPF